MRNILFTALLFILLTTSTYAQKIYSVQNESQADVKVYVVSYESQADLKVFKVKYESQAGQKRRQMVLHQVSQSSTKENLLCET
jgi:hypothetical protein